MFKLTKLHLKTRRRISLGVTSVFIAGFAWIAYQQRIHLGRPDVFTGSTVFAGLVLLCLLGVRRRLPFWPLGSVSAWTQFHLYLGFFTTAIYVLHVPTLIAGGMFESILAGLFLMVSASGFYGLFASRSLPKKLTAVEGQHRFDRISWTRQQIADAGASACASIEESSAHQVLGTFYREVLSPFFGTSPPLAYVILPNGNRRRRLLGDLRELDRYLENDGRKIAGQLAALVRRRDDLDYQFALQLRLRCWVVVHSVLSLVLLIASMIHVLLVVRFLG